MVKFLRTAVISIEDEIEKLTFSSPITAVSGRKISIKR